MVEFGRKTTLPDALLAELGEKVKRCWTIPPGWRDPREVAVTLRFLLRRDGTLDGEPSVVEFPATPAGAASAKAAIAAVTRCGPFHLPAEQYEQWKDIQLKLAP
jgi:colicin import membrane protein